MEGAMEKEECSDEGMKMAEMVRAQERSWLVPFCSLPGMYLQYLSDRSFFEKTFLGWNHNIITAE